MNWKFYILFGILLIVIYLLFVHYIMETHIDLPEGTWKESCEVMSWSNPELTAECVDSKGRPNITTINLNQCTEIELEPEQVEKRNEGINLEHKHYSNDRGSYFHIHKLINDNGVLKCDAHCVAN